jgi:hypothetical protein
MHNLEVILYATSMWLPKRKIREKHGKITSKKRSANRLIKAFEGGEFYSPDLADAVEKASKEFRKNFKTRDVEL